METETNNKTEDASTVSIAASENNNNAHHPVQPNTTTTTTTTTNATISTGSITGSNNSIRASSRKNRVYVFREFLLQTYQEYWNQVLPSSDNENNNNPNAILLDVAGGKGDLSWLLLNVDGIDSIVLDPRPLSSSSHLIRSVEWLNNHPEEAQQRAIPNLPTHQPLAGLIPQIMMRKQRHQSRRQRRRRQTSSIDRNTDAAATTTTTVVDNNAVLQQEENFLEPQSLQIKLDQEFINVLQNALLEEKRSNATATTTAAATPDDDCPESWKFFWNTKMKEIKTTRQQQSEEAWFLPASEHNKTKKYPVVHSKVSHQDDKDPCQVWKLLRSIRLVLGFHPDQATEACVDLADLLHVPVCIVPCCVFPSEFPSRMIEIETTTPDDCPRHRQQQQQQQQQPKNGTEDETVNTTTTIYATTMKTTSITKTRVRDYSQLLQYLQQKQPKLRTARLSFHQTETSRNVVLYTLPEDIP